MVIDVKVQIVEISVRKYRQRAQIFFYSFVLGETNINAIAKCARPIASDLHEPQIHMP